MEFIEKIERIIMGVLKWALIFLLIAVTISVSWGVFTRYVLNAAAQWTHEFSGFTLAWITFLGSAYAILKGNHIRFETIFEMLPRKVRLVIQTILNSAVFVFVVYLSYYGYHLAMRSMGNATVSLPLPKGFFFAIIPVGGALMAIALIIDTLKAFKKKEEPSAQAIAEAQAAAQAQSLEEERLI